VQAIHEADDEVNLEVGSDYNHTYLRPACPSVADTPHGFSRATPAPISVHAVLSIGDVICI